MSANPPDAPTPPLHRTTPEVEILDHHQQGSAWSTFHRIAYRVRRADATWVTQEREFLDRGDAVALLPFCPTTGNVLLTRQFRMPVYLRRPEEAMLLEVCGGILDDPDPAVTLRHEAMEELGIELGHFEKVFEGTPPQAPSAKRSTTSLPPTPPNSAVTAAVAISTRAKTSRFSKSPSPRPSVSPAPATSATYARSLCSSTSPPPARPCTLQPEAPALIQHLRTRCARTTFSSLAAVRC